MPDLLELPSYTDPNAIAPPEPQKKPEQSNDSLDSDIDRIADHFGVPRELWRAQVAGKGKFQGESGGRVDVGNSPKGAGGLFQIMPATAANIKKPNGQSINPKDPLEAAYGAFKLLSDNYKRFRPMAQSDRHAWGMALAGYHGNPENVIKDLKRGGVGIPDQDDGYMNTQDYVYHILSAAPGVGQKAVSGAAMTAPVAQEATSQTNTQPAPSFPVTTNVPAGGYLPHAQQPSTGITPESQSPTAGEGFYGLETPGVVEGVRAVAEKDAQSKAAVDRAFGPGVWEQTVDLKPEDRAKLIDNAQHMNTISDVTRLGEELGKEQDAARRAAIRRRHMDQRVAIKKAAINPQQAANDIQWHFGDEGLERFGSLPVDQQRQMITIAHAAARRDKQKKLSDPEFQPQINPDYQAQMRRRIPGLAQPAVSRQQAQQTVTDAGLQSAARTEQAQKRIEQIVNEEQTRTVMPGDVEDPEARITARLVNEGLIEKGPKPKSVSNMFPVVAGDKFESKAWYESEDRANIANRAREITNSQQDELRKNQPSGLRRVFRDLTMLSPATAITAHILGRGSIADEPTVRAALGQTGPQVLGGLSDSVADLLHFVDTGGGLVKGNSYVAAGVSKLRDFGAYMQGSADVTPQSKAESFAKSAGAGVGGIEEIAILRGATGLPFWAIMGGRAALKSQDKPLKEQAWDTTWGVAQGLAYEFGPKVAIKMLGKLPGTVGQTITTLAKQYPATSQGAVASAGFGGLTYHAERARGASRGEALAAAAGTGLGMFALSASEAMRELERAEIPERIIASDKSPEWLREFAGKATKTKPVIVQTDAENPRYSSVYVDPENPGRQIVRPVEQDEAQTLKTRGRPTKVVTESEFNRVMGAAEPSPTGEVAPINRQIESPTSKTAPTERSESPSPKEPPAPVVEPAQESSVSGAAQLERVAASTPSKTPKVAENITQPITTAAAPSERGTSAPQEAPRTVVSQTPVEAEPTAPGEKHPVTGRKYTSTQVDLPPEFAKLQQQAAAQIPDSELSEDGRESDAHITVKYGLHTENPADVRDVLSGEGPIKAKVGKVSIFPASGDRNYDVVKMEVASPDLHRLNAKIAKNLKVTNTHPEYKPHITLAYVKAGEGQKYVGKSNGLTGKTITIDKLTFSGRSGQEEVIPLKGLFDAKTVRGHEESIRGGRVGRESEVQSSTDQSSKDLQQSAPAQPLTTKAGESNQAAGAVTLEKLREAGAEVLNPDEVAQGAKPKIRVRAPEQSKELARITPKQIVRHSDPNIDGGEVIGRFPDGDLKVQNKEGGISRVQDPRREGNREAAVTKVGSPPVRESIPAPARRGIQVKVAAVEDATEPIKPPPNKRIFQTRQEYVSERMRNLTVGSDPIVAQRSAIHEHEYAVKKASQLRKDNSPSKFDEMVAFKEITPERAVEVLKSLGERVPNYIKRQIARLQGQAFEVVGKKMAGRVGRPNSDPEVNSEEAEVRARGGIKTDADGANRGEIASLKESGKRGLVNESSGMTAEDMAVALAQDGYGDGRWSGLDVGNGIDVGVFLDSITEDSAGSQKHYSTAYDPAIVDHPDDEAFSKLEDDEYGKELLELVQSGHARAADIAELARVGRDHGLSDEGLQAFLRAMDEQVKSEVSETPQDEGYSLDDEGTLLDPDGQPLFSRIAQPGLGFGDSEGLLAEGGPQPISSVRSDSAKQKQIAELNRKHAEFQREREQEVFGEETAKRLTSLAEIKDRVGKIAQTILSDRRMASRPDSTEYIQSLLDAMETVRGAQAARLPLTDYLRQDSLFGEPVSSEVAELAHGIEAGNFRFMEESRPLMMAREQTESDEFKRWFGDSKVVDEDGKPLVVYSGHGNMELYGDRFDPKRRGAAGAFYATESTDIASNYAHSKLGGQGEYHEQGSQYRFKLKNGNWGKKLWQIELTPEQQKVARNFINHNDEGEQQYDIEKYWKENAAYDEDSRRALARGGLRDLQSIWQFLEYMGDNIAYPEEDKTDAEGNRKPYFQRQRKNTFEGLLDKLGIEWQSADWAQPGVFPIYLQIRNPIDAEKPFPPDLLTALKSAAKRTRTVPEGKEFDAKWTADYPLRQWVQEIEDGYEYWSTQVPAKAIPIIKSFGYDGIKEIGMKGETDRAKRQVNWIAFEPTQIKSAIGNRGTFDLSDPNILHSSRTNTSELLDSLKTIDDDTELIRNLKSSREADIVWVNPEGQELIRRMESESASGFFGIQIDRDSAIPILRDLKAGSQALRSASLSSTAIDDLHRQIVDALQAGKGHALIVMEGESSETAIKHESFHQGSALGADEKPLADRHTSENQERLHSMAAVAKWRRYFQRTPGLTNASKALAIEETAAEIAGDGGQRIGLSEQESAEFIYEWAKSFYETNGPKAFEAFRRQEDHVNKAIEAAKRFGYQVEAQKSLASGKVVRGRKGSARGQPEGSVSEVRPQAPGLGRRIELRGQGEVREASLPETLSVAGLDTEGLYYQGFTDAQGRSDAAELLERHGVEGSLRLLKDTPNPGKEHAVLSFMVQRLLLDQAATASSQGNEPEAARLRSEQQELAAAHASHATHSGQFNQAAASAGVSVETALTVAQRIVQNEYGVNARVNPRIAGRIEEHARAAEQAFGETMALTVELGELRKRVAQLETERGTRNPRNAVRIQLEAEEQGLINVVVKAFTLPPGALKMAIAKQIESPEFKKWFRDSKVVDEAGKPLVVYHGGMPGVTSFDVERAGKVNHSDWGKGIYFTPVSWMAKGYREDAALANDPDEDRLWKEYEAEAKRLGTSPMMQTIDLGFGSEKYNQLEEFKSRWQRNRDRVRAALASHDQGLYPVFLRIENPFIYQYEGMTDPFMADHAKAKGHDGILIVQDDGDIEEAVAFVPEQIKSAIGNEGAFDPKNPNILKMASPSALDTEAREALAKLGVLELIRNPDGSIEDWNASLRETIGEGVEPYLVEAYTDAFALRRRMLKDAREAAVINEFHASHPDATEDELAEYLETQKTARERAKLVSGEKATKTRLLIRINELKTLIETGEKSVKGASATNPDIELLKSERDRLQGVVDEMVGPQATPEEKRIELATKAVRKAIADYDKRIAEGQIAPESKSNVAPWSEELGRLQSQRADLRKQLNEIRKQTNAPTKQRNTIAAQLKSVTKSIGELEGRIQSGNVAPRTSGTPKPTSPEIEAAKAQRKILAKLLADMRRAARPRQVKTSAEQEAARHLPVTRIIGDLSPSNIVAETAGKILFGHKTAYSDLLDAGILKSQAIGIVKQAREIVSKAKQQAEWERLAKAVEKDTGRKALDDEIDRVATERLLAKKRGSNARAELARDLDNLTKSPLWKAKDVLVDLSNSSRSILAAGDLSAVLRQGGFLTLAYPEKQAQPIKLMLQAITELGELKAKELLENDPVFGLAIRSGIDFAELGRESGSLVKGEEVFRGDMAKKIPGIGAIVRASDRTYATFLDAQRLTTFRQFADELQAMGYSFRENPQAFRDVARLINIATGRGHLLGFGSHKLAAFIMNLPFFSPRNTISRFQLLNITLNPVAYARLSPGSRYIVARSALRYYGMVAALLGLASLLGFKVVMDWNDPDFLKIQSGNTRFEIPGGVGLPARLLLRLTDIAIRGGRYPGERKEQTIKELKQFARGKLAPGPALAWDWYTGENYQGQTFRWVSMPRADKSAAENVRRFMFEGAIAERVWMLPIQDVQQAWHEDGFGAALKTFPATELGVGATTYKDNPLKPTTRAERLAAQLASRGFNSEPEPEEKGETRQKLTELRSRSMKNEDVKSELDKMVQSGEISNMQAKNVEGAKGLSKLEYWVRKLPPDQALLVVKEGSPAERRELLPLLYGKVQRAAPGSLNGETQTDMAKLSPDLAKLFEQRKPVESELIKHDMKFPEADATISIGNRDIKLTGDKLLNYQKRVDALVYERLPKIIQSSEYQSADPSIQKKMLQEAASMAHGLATAEIKTELAPSDRILAGQLRREQVRSQKLGTNTKVMRLRSERRQEVQERIHPQP